MRKKICLLLLHPVVAGVFAQPPALTVEQARDLYLERNPALAAERERIEAARGAERQARVRPSPELHYSQESYPLGGEDVSFFRDQEFTFWATQRFELGNKRRHRAAVADLAVRIAEAEFEDFKRRGSSEVRRAYAEAYFSQQKRTLALEHLDLYQRLREVHRRRLEEGDVSGLAQLRIDLEEIRFVKAATEAETGFFSAWSRLAALIGWSESEIPELRLDPAPPAEGLELAGLLARAERQRPDLAAFALERDQLEEGVRLERSGRIPDLTLGGGYKRNFGTDSFYAAAQLPLPLFDRKQGLVAEAQARLRRAENLFLWKRLEVRAEVERALHGYRSWRASLERLRENTLARAARVLEVTRLSYQEGEAGLNDYLDTLRVRLETSLAFHDLLLEVEKARVELDRALGGEP